LSEDGVLSSWSQRKLKVADEKKRLDLKQLDETSLPLTKEVQGQAEAIEEDEFAGKTDSEILQTLELPDPETLKLGDNVVGFMDGRVPDRIRHKALRAFWKTNPLLANIDGLDEYCDDYTDAVMCIENMQTIYEVGKGYASLVLDTLESLSDESSEDVVGVDSQSKAEVHGAELIETESEFDNLQEQEQEQEQAEWEKVEETDVVTAEISTPPRMQFS